MRCFPVRYKFVGLVVGLVVLWPVATAAAEPDSLAACDQFYAAGNLTASAAIARRALTLQPDCYEAAWRLSRSLISAGNLAESEGESERLYQAALTQAHLAVALNPQGTRGYTCLAICNGNLSNFAGGREMITMAEEARTAARKAIALDGDNDLAHLVLGVWNREIATVGGLAKLAAKLIYGGVPEGASLEESEACLRRAIALAPEHLNHHRELAITLLELDRRAEAITELEIAVSLSPRQPEDAVYAASARELLVAALLAEEQEHQRHW